MTGDTPPVEDTFPFLFGGAFIEGKMAYPLDSWQVISLPFRRGFH